MPLTLVTGPAGSGKTGELLERFAAWLEREPVLVVPARADVERFEDELLARRPVALGGRVVTFERLVDLAMSAAGRVSPQALSPAQRRAVLAAVANGTRLDSLARPARRPGFVPALDELVAEAQGALLDPSQLDARLRASGAFATRAHLREVVRLYAAYVERREALGRADRGSLLESAVEALRDRPGAWGDRPVLLHGFDDLTPAQLALTAAIATGAEVVVSALHEPGRACLAARDRLVERIEALGPVRREALSPREGAGFISHLERTFLVDDPPSREPGEALRLLDAAGARNELELVGAIIARLLREGTAPDQIAVVLRSPEARAGLVEEVFGALAVPAAIHAQRPLTGTAAGRGLLALVRAALTTRTAADLVSFLRSPGRASIRGVDRLERAVRVRGLESSDEALEVWEADGGRQLWELETVRAAAARPAPELLERLAGIARTIAQFPYRRAAPSLEGPERADQLAAETAARSLIEVGELAALDPSLAPDPEGIVELLADLSFPRSSGSVAGRVEVMSPYRARARQFAHVFVVSLQEGDFPRQRRDDPFLGDAERRAAGFPDRAEARDEERYLFYVAVTRATRRLTLSARSADDEGQAETRSFLVDEVLDLLPPGAEPRITASKGLGDTVFEPSEAPTERELGRALAARDLTAPAPALGASPELAARLTRSLEDARDRAGRRPGPFEVEFVLEELRRRKRIGASSLETYAECPFRYLVGHELRPRELAPDSEPLTRGGITHRVLERLYEERRAAGGPVRATPETLAELLARAREILAEEAEPTSLAPRRPAPRATYMRMESDIARMLRYDARHDDGVEVAHLEASFGDEEDEKGALELGDFGLHGKIDRIDVAASGQALVRDYKSGSKVTAREKLAAEGKLQLPLYLLAARELWGLDAVGAVYHPLGNQSDDRPRGLIRGPKAELPFSDRFFKGDVTEDAKAFDRDLAQARAAATGFGEQIRAGHLGREPLGGSCPRYCDFHPICRRERGEKNPEDLEERGDAEQADG